MCEVYICATRKPPAFTAPALNASNRPSTRLVVTVRWWPVRWIEVAHGPRYQAAARRPGLKMPAGSNACLTRAWICASAQTLDQIGR
jgi:hypothetical protein